MLIAHLEADIFVKELDNPHTVGWNGHSWLLTDALGAPTVQILGTLLWVISVIGFVVAGLALLNRRNEWRLIDIITSLVSLIVYILFWYDLQHTRHRCTHFQTYLKNALAHKLFSLQNT